MTSLLGCTTYIDPKLGFKGVISFKWTHFSYIDVYYSSQGSLGEQKQQSESIYKIWIY